MKKCCQRLREKVTASCNLNGVEVDDETHADLKLVQFFVYNAYQNEN